MMAAPTRVSRSSNTVALLNVLQQGPTSQADLAERLGLNQASVSRIIQSLLDVGLIRARPGPTPTRGRPVTHFEVDPTSRSAIGVHLGRTKVHVGVTDLEGGCQYVVTEPRDARTPAATLEQIATLAHRVARHAPAPAVGVGITATGEVDTGSGVIRDNHSLGWQNVDVVTPLSRSLGLPVTLDGVVRNLLSAELAYGSLDGSRRALLVLAGDLVECGYTIPATGPLTTVVRGDLSQFLVPGFRPDQVGTFGELGSSRVLLTAAAERGLRVDSIAALLRAGEQDDPVAVDLLTARVRQVTTAIRALADVLHSEVVLLGGLTTRFSGTLDLVRRALADRLEPSAIRHLRTHDAPLISPPAALAIREALRHGTIGHLEQSA